VDKSLYSTFAATLFALLNPLGVLPFYIGYVAGERAGVQRFVALLLSVTVLALLLLFLTTGAALLKFFGIDLDSFRVAGGILLLLIGIGQVTGKSNEAKSVAGDELLTDWQEAQSVYRAIVIPIAMPLLVGPGVIANVILYANEVRAKPDGYFPGGLALVCLAVSALVLIILLSGRWLKRILGNTGLSIATRILGLLVASMGVQFISTGLTDIIVHSVAPQILNRK
jgi:multiple antibiotic resistance protein